LLFFDRDPHFVNGSFWTLGIEWRWYFAMPVLLWVWTKSPRLFALVAAAAFVLYHATALRAIDVGVLPAFMLGIVAADVAAFERRNAFVRFALPFCLIAIAAGVALEPKSSTEFYVQDQLAWQLAAFFFVVAAGSLAPLRTMLSWLPIAVVGLASYSIYLVHEPIVALVQQTTPYGPLMAASIALLAGALFFMLFERPFLREPLRGRAIAFVSVPFERLCRWCGFESSRLTLWVKQLADTTAPPPAVAPVPLPAVVAPANATATEAAP
jgi:peptidoglycan/LPS O-acetylase OafA/YrhL